MVGVKKSLRSMLVLGLALVAMFVVACGGDDDNGFNFPAPPNILGTWVGTFTDSLGSGTAILTITDQGTSILPASFSGTWAQTYTGGTVAAATLGSGSSIVQNTEGVYAINFFLLYASGCGANGASARLNEAQTVFTGTSGGDCSSSGTFTLTKQ